AHASLPLQQAVPPPSPARHRSGQFPLCTTVHRRRRIRELPAPSQRWHIRSQVNHQRVDVAPLSSSPPLRRLRKVYPALRRAPLLTLPSIIPPSPPAGSS